MGTVDVTFEGLAKRKMGSSEIQAKERADNCGTTGLSTSMDMAHRVTEK